MIILNKIKQYFYFNQIRENITESHLSKTDLFVNILGLGIFSNMMLYVFLLFQKLNVYFAITATIGLTVLIIVLAHRFLYNHYLGDWAMPKIMYNIGMRFHDIFIKVLLAVLGFVIYAIISSVIPHGALTLSNNIYESSGSLIQMFVVGVFFVFLQPIIDGFIFRGYLTELASRYVSQKYVYVIVVLIYSFSHVISNISLPLFLLALFQAVYYQYLRNKFGIAISIQINMIINLLIFSTM